jgi:O-antigen/teichoic acid export membrane protein
VASTISAVVSIIVVYKIIQPEVRRFDPRISVLSLELVKRSKWLTISSLAAYGYLSFDEQIIGAVRSAAELGAYKSGKLLADATNSIISVSSILLYPKFIDHRKRDPAGFQTYVWRVALAHTLPATILVGAAFALGATIHGKVFGAQFEAGGGICSLLIASKAIVLVSNVFSWALLSDQQNFKQVALIIMGASVMSLAANHTFVPLFGIQAAAISVLLCEAFNLCAYMILFHRGYKVTNRC